MARPASAIDAPRPAAAPRGLRASLTWVDAVVFACVVAFLAYVAWRANTVLHYRWNWDPVWSFILRFDPEQGRWIPNLILQGLLTTIRVSIWAGLAAAAIGLVMGVCRIAHNLFLRWVARSYVEFIRNIPPLVFIFVVYFFVASQVMPALGVEDWVRNASPETLATIDFLLGPPQFLPALLSAILCLALFEGAYVTEIVRAGIQSIDKGQWEAGRSLGLSPLRLMRLVILPQAVARVVPPLAGQFISLVKDSSIVSLVSIQDLTFLGNEVAATTTRVFEVWITVAALYFVLCFALSLAFGRLERRLSRHLAR
jgi:polar amino acid transport system permease protein